MAVPSSRGSMIWYVPASLSIPSWWMPASCAKALAPTIGLFGADRVAGQVADERRRVADHAGVDPRLGVEDVGAHTHRHRELLERGVARTLADPVDRALDLSRTRPDTRERVRDREAEVVVAVNRELDAGELGAALDQSRRTGPAYSAGERVADRVGQVDDRRAGRDGGAAHLGEERAIGARRVLGGELDLVRLLRGVGHRPANPLEHLVGREPELALHVQRARRDEDVHAPPVRARKRGRRGIDVLGGRPGERGDRHARRRRPRRRRRLRSHPATMRRTRPRSRRRRAVRASTAISAFSLGRQGDARRLLAVSQSRVEDLDPAHSFRSSVSARGSAGALIPS